MVGILALLTTILPQLIQIGGIATSVTGILAKMNAEGRTEPTPEEIAEVDALVVAADAEWADIVQAAKDRIAAGNPQ